MRDADDKQLEEALKADVDLHGGDPSLALSVAEMSTTEKQTGRDNLRSFAAELRATLRRPPPDDAPGSV